MTKLKTRQEIANELGISTKTLNRRIKEAALNISSGLLTIHEQQLILSLFSGISVA
jgi:DNA-binding transcriptional regulator LsrR (DeoR family)